MGDQRRHRQVPDQDIDAVLSSAESRASGAYRHVSMRQIDFPPTVEADLLSTNRTRTDR